MSTAQSKDIVFPVSNVAVVVCQFLFYTMAQVAGLGGTNPDVLNFLFHGGLKTTNDTVTLSWYLYQQVTSKNDMGQGARQSIYWILGVDVSGL